MDGTKPLIVFRNGASRTGEVVCTKIENIDKRDVAFEFVPVDGDKVAQHYTHANGKLVYAPPAAIDASVLPNPAKLKDDIEAAIEAGSLPVQVLQYYDKIILSARPKALYAKFKSAAQFMSASHFTMLEALASNANVPLT